MTDNPPGLHSPRTHVLGMIPSILLAGLSKFTCAWCLAAYAGVLSSLGAGALATDTGLVALTLVLLTVATTSVGWSARRHRQLGPVILTALGAITVAGARLSAAGTGWLLLGSVLMIAASLWNLRAGRRSVPVVQLGGRSTAGNTNLNSH